MFDFFANLLSSIASFLFPVFASYKALKTSDPAQLIPWLMYWVVLACALLVESWTHAILVWIPLYPYLRLLFLLYLVLPQTQGAQIIYTTYVHPYLEDNESQIEDLIATTHDKMKAAGMAYLKQAIELLRTQVLGMAPSPEATQTEASNIPASQRPRSYTQALLDRFQLPAARWMPAGSNAAAGSDLYNFLSSAVVAATGTGANPTTDKENEASGDRSVAGAGVGAFPAGYMSASGTLVLPSIPDNAEKMTFLAAQRERLSMMLGALDREAAQLRSGLLSPSVQDYNLDGVNTPVDRPATSASAKSGLSKSRSEADFVKIEAESGEEEEETETARPVHARSGSWIPWGWGGAAAASGPDAEKTKDE